MKTSFPGSVVGLCRWWRVAHSEQVTRLAITAEIMPDGADELLAEIEHAADVELVLNSRGGDATTTLRIFDALRGKCSVVRIEFAASAAAVLAMAGPIRVIHEDGRMMVHSARSLVFATGCGLLDAADITFAADVRSFDIFAEATKQPRATVQRWLAGDDHWFNAEQAKEAGLAQEIIRAPVPAETPAGALNQPAPTISTQPTADEEFIFKMLAATGRITVRNRRAFIQRFCQWAVTNQIQTETES